MKRTTHTCEATNCNTPLTFISLFSGFGGIDLGFERAGLRCIAQVEINEYARQVLAKHWPNVRRFTDIQEVATNELPDTDVIVGGFPCQDVSTLGNRIGIAGARSGLWLEFARIVADKRPAYVFVENVPDLLSRGGIRVFSDLTAMGYDAEWLCFPATAIGANHKRDRLAIVAYSARIGMETATRQNRQSFGNGQISSRLDTFRKSRAEWLLEPELDRMVNGVSAGLERDIWEQRLIGLGNAVVPAWAEFIALQILMHEGR